MACLGTTESGSFIRKDTEYRTELRRVVYFHQSVPVGYGPGLIGSEDSGTDPTHPHEVFLPCASPYGIAVFRPHFSTKTAKVKAYLPLVVHR